VVYQVPANVKRFELTDIKNLLRQVTKDGSTVESCRPEQIIMNLKVCWHKRLFIFCRFVFFCYHLFILVWGCETCGRAMYWTRDNGGMPITWTMAFDRSRKCLLTRRTCFLESFHRCFASGQRKRNLKCPQNSTIVFFRFGLDKMLSCCFFCKRSIYCLISHT
jgi:hypothetical protein